MGKKRLCECGSVADWAEIDSTWICVGCRDSDVRKNIDEFKNALWKLEQTAGALHLLKVDTLPVMNLLTELKTEIDKIVV